MKYYGNKKRFSEHFVKEDKIQQTFLTISQNNHHIMLIQCGGKVGFLQFCLTIKYSTISM